MKTSASFILVERYAKALFKVSEAKALTGKVHRELGSLARAFADNETLAACLLHPFISEEEKLETVSAFIVEKEAWGLVQVFLTELIRHKRLALMPKILLSFTSLVDESKNFSRAAIKSCRALDSKQKQSTQEALETVFKRKVICDWKQDPELIGGLQIKVGDAFWDGSIRGRLAALKSYLRASRVNELARGGI